MALYSTESQLYAEEANERAQILERLERAHLAKDEQFRRLVIGPVEAEMKSLQEKIEASQTTAEKKGREFLRLRRATHKCVAELSIQIERRYRDEYAKALSYQDGYGAIRGNFIGATIQKLNESHHDLRQPMHTTYEPTSNEYLFWIREQSQKLLSEDSSLNVLSFRSLLNQLAERCNGTAVIAPLKNLERTTQKAQDKYSGNFSRLLDYIRGMVVFSNIPNLADALAQLEQMHQEGTITILRAKDRFSQRYDAYENVGGYRDCLFNLSLPNRDGVDIVTELQFHLDVFLKLKDSVGHENYEAARDIHMFNPTFTTKSFFWEPDHTSQEDIDDLLEGIQSGVITRLNLDYSRGLWSADAQQQLADSLISPTCFIRELSLQSCRCGDDFIFKCLPESNEYLWTQEPLIQTVRLGSQLHEGTAGRISRIGIAHLLKHANKSLRVLDLEGCTDLAGFENCGDEVVEAIAEHAQSLKDQKDTLVLPALHELNLRSTGLTKPGFDLLTSLREEGSLPTLEVLVTDDVIPEEPTKVPVGAHRRAATKKKRESEFLKSFLRKEAMKDMDEQES